ncbi:MAG: HAD-IIB family hydrolase, partial [Firmicutes bacterium]|nr:HAD-IIB family hydrolase [Bacillota bacterium]
MIKLVSLDLDGTLLMEDHTIPDAVVATLQEAAARGTKFAIATGRSFTSAKLFADRLGIDCACICYNGGMVRRMDGSIVLSEPLDAGQVAAITAFCKEKGLYFQCYDPDSILVEKICHWTHMDNDTHLSVVRELGDISKVAPFPSPKMVVFGSEGALDDALHQLQQRFGDSCHMALSLSFILEVTRTGTTK